MSAAAAWRWCLAAGLLAFACSWGFGRIPGLIVCGPTLQLGPILAFEFARAPADVAALFGAEPCRSTLVAAQRTGLWLDALGFIPSYTAFLSFAAWATGTPARRWIVAALLVAGLCDQIEGALLFAILRALPGTPALLDALWWPVHLKFLLLGVGTLAIGIALMATRRRFGLVVGAVAGGGGVYALVGYLGLPAPGMMTGFTIAWFALLVGAAIGAAWPRLFAARPQAPTPPSA